MLFDNFIINLIRCFLDTFIKVTLMKNSLAVIPYHDNSGQSFHISLRTVLQANDLNF